MDKPICSRCGKAAALSLAEISGTPVLNNYLVKTHYTHLCRSCVTALEGIQKQILRFPYSESLTNLVEGIHFTMENGLVVFTELYHISRGYCCQNNCRNCAYGFRLKKIN